MTSRVWLVPVHARDNIEERVAELLGLPMAVI